MQGKLRWLRVTNWIATSVLNLFGGGGFVIHLTANYNIACKNDMIGDITFHLSYNCIFNQNYGHFGLIRWLLNHFISKKLNFSLYNHRFWLYNHHFYHNGNMNFIHKMAILRWFFIIMGNIAVNNDCCIKIIPARWIGLWKLTPKVG